MHLPRTRLLVILTLVLAGLSVAPAAPEKSSKPSPLAEARIASTFLFNVFTWAAIVDSKVTRIW